MIKFYNKGIKEVFQHFDSSENGLSSSDAYQRLKNYGKNKLTKKGIRSPILIFFSQFKDMLIILLVIAAVISFLTGSRNDAVVISIIVFANAYMGFRQEFKAEKALEALKKMISPKTKVLRNGEVKEIYVENVVPGDILVLEEGNKIPADARLIEAINLKVEESPLTGESIAVKKSTETIKKEHVGVSEATNMVFMGTSVIFGRAKAIVTSTGMDTEFGKIAELTTTFREEQSPLQKEMVNVGKFITKFAAVSCIFVFLYGILLKGESLKSMFVIVIALAVAVVPEGLPSTITVALTNGIRKMVKVKAIVRHLSSIETLGCTTYICSDKTGTITKNEMTVEQIFTNNKIITITGDGYNTDGGFSEKDVSNYDLILKIGLLCNNASYGKEIIGDPTEISLLVAGAKAKMYKKELETKEPRVFEVPFDSEKKIMITVHRTEKKSFVYAKGAPNELISRCVYIQINKKIKKLTDKEKLALLEKNRDMASGALRVLAIAYKEVKNSDSYAEKEMNNNLIFVGFVGMIDPPRDDIKEALELCKKAGIKVMMITGDQRTTARAVAIKIGLIGPEDKIITGQELESISEEGLSKIIKEVKVFARTSPKDKLRIIDALRMNDEVVAMTGDGVNDAPALKKADIGVAMGITGTDVSKEASDIVLMDDSFPTIVKAVREGRGIYDNIKKFILYALTGILTELFCVVIGFMATPPHVKPLLLIITAIQILWIDLGSEVLTALSLGADPPEESIMERKPRNIRKRIINRDMVFALLRFSIWNTTFAAILFFYFLHSQGIVKAQTIAFTMVVIFQMYNIFNCRNTNKSVFNKNLFKNRYLIGAVLFTTLLQIMIVQLPFMNNFFGTTPLSIGEWVLIFLVGSTIIVMDEIRKLAWKPNTSLEVI